MFNSLRVRLTVIFIILTIIPLILVGALIASRGSDTLESQAVVSQKQLARQTAISLGAFFQERQNELFILTDVYGLDSFDPDVQQDVLSSSASRFPTIFCWRRLSGSPRRYKTKQAVMLDTSEIIQLLRKMGHDMRVPLNTLISTSDMLMEGTYDTPR